MINIINALEQKVYNGILLSFEEALELSKTKDLEGLFHAADRIREKHHGNGVDLCSIMNAKSGLCSEDCKFCAQSAHYTTDIQKYSLVNIETTVSLAKKYESEKVNRFSLVTSGRGLAGEDFSNVLNIYKHLKKSTNINLCASLGILDYNQLIKLKEVGITAYHHNLETSSSFYSKVCSTHSYEDRISTIKNAKSAGLDICSGGIIGMGETMEDRISLALELQKLAVKSIPINILTPIKGTPLEDMKPLPEKEILKTIALFRFINPKAYIRLAAGRIHLENSGVNAFRAGANAALTGNFLTTCGNNVADDIAMLESIKLEILKS